MAVTAVGAAARVTGVTVFDGVDRTPSPNDVTARTRKLYAVPLVSAGHHGGRRRGRHGDGAHDGRPGQDLDLVLGDRHAAGVRRSGPGHGGLGVARRRGDAAVGGRPGVTTTDSFAISPSEKRSRSTLRRVSVPSAAVPAGVRHGRRGRAEGDVVVRPRPEKMAVSSGGAVGRGQDLPDDAQLTRVDRAGDAAGPETSASVSTLSISTRRVGRAADADAHVQLARHRR